MSKERKNKVLKFCESYNSEGTVTVIFRPTDFIININGNRNYDKWEEWQKIAYPLCRNKKQLKTWLATIGKPFFIARKHSDYGKITQNQSNYCLIT